MSDKYKKPFKRKFISLEVKIHILDRLLKGEKASDIGKSLNLNEATIRTIKKNEKGIRSAVAAGSSTSAKRAARPRAPIIEKMEKALGIWLDDCRQKRIPLDGCIIKQKALKIYKHLKEQGESPANPDFVASKGWLEKFKKRFQIDSIRTQGESASADHEAGRTYPENFQNIEEEGYREFNADEMLWWERMPSRKLISRKEKLHPEKRLKIWPSALETENACEIEPAKAIGGEGFVDMSTEDVQELLVEKEVDEVDLMQMVSVSLDQVDSEDASTDEDCAVNNLTLEKLQEGLSLAENLKSFFLNVDPSIKRSRKFERELQNCLAPYREIYNDLVRTKNQSKITNFFNGEDAKTINKEKTSECEGDTIPPQKRSHSDDEEID